MSIVRRIMDENAMLRAENSAMRRMLEHIVGPDEYLRLYAVDEAMSFLGVEAHDEPSGSDHG